MTNGTSEVILMTKFGSINEVKILIYIYFLDN